MSPNPDKLNNSTDCGSLVELGKLGDSTIISEASLAEKFGKRPVSIRRAVERGELPPPVRLMGKRIWTVEALRAHLRMRLDEAREEKEKAMAKIHRLRP